MGGWLNPKLFQENVSHDTCHWIAAAGTPALALKNPEVLAALLEVLEINVYLQMVMIFSWAFFQFPIAG